MTKTVGEKEPTVIMYDSAEAAKKVQQLGWKSRLGHFYPGDTPSSEHGARWSGCTHMICECGQKIENRKPGEDLYTFPTFTIPEAAEELGIDGWTLLNWYSKREPLLHPSAWYGEEKAFALLSFRDLEEAYKLHLLRTNFGQSMQYLHKALTEAGKEANSLHPLIDCKLIVFSYLALDKPARGRGKRKVLPLGFEGAKSQLIPEVVDAWGRRIVADSKGKTVRMYPYRLAKSDDHSRPVSMDPEVLSGRLVVTGTRIPVRVLHSRSLGGETPEQIASDYGISPELVQKALIHFTFGRGNSIRRLAQWAEDRKQQRPSALPEWRSCRLQWPYRDL